MSFGIKQEFIDFSHHLADVSGHIAKQYFRSDLEEVKKNDNSPVTKADKEIESKIRDEIIKKYPTHGIIGEEFDDVNKDADYKWVIDPIDGTISFAIGKPIFGTLIALTYQNKPVIGIINQPINNERWWGVTGGLSYFNDKIIKTKICQSISDAVFCTQSPFFFTGKIKEQIDKITSQTKYQHQGGAIYCGDCYHFALLANGYVDIIIEHGLNNFDFLALVPIIESAGGIITDWNGKKLDINSDGRIIATSNKYIYDLIIKYINIIS
tara:strand:- start:34724 stop:35524 length:801 start_codon:yes stop_codon:yes gene_type:complete